MHTCANCAAEIRWSQQDILRNLLFWRVAGATFYFCCAPCREQWKREQAELASL